MFTPAQPQNPGPYTFNPRHKTLNSKFYLPKLKLKTGLLRKSPPSPAPSPTGTNSLQNKHPENEKKSANRILRPYSPDPPNRIPRTPKTVFPGPGSVQILCKWEVTVEYCRHSGIFLFLNFSITCGLQNALRYNSQPYSVVIPQHPVCRHSFFKQNREAVSTKTKV